MEKKLLKLRVNGEDYEVYAEPWHTLQEVLRNDLSLTGLKKGCDTGYCGACTVLLNGKAVKSCVVLARQAQGYEITTVEGLAKNGELDPLQQAFIDKFAIQCGFCTPGMLLSTKALFMENPHPTEDDIKEAIKGNLCRCTGYKKIIEAIQAAV
ncbi:MAG: (2Fe-2S)-binding protein, partial [Chloroflexota bacterium]|nr:(2Fe-2S)-binding protein [Chloroflexota bacterium]